MKASVLKSINTSFNKLVEGCDLALNLNWRIVTNWIDWLYQRASFWTNKYNTGKKNLRNSYKISLLLARGIQKQIDIILKQQKIKSKIFSFIYGARCSHISCWVFKKFSWIMFLFSIPMAYLFFRDFETNRKCPKCQGKNSQFKEQDNIQYNFWLKQKKKFCGNKLTTCK